MLEEFGSGLGLVVGVRDRGLGQGLFLGLGFKHVIIVF